MFTDDDRRQSLHAAITLPPAEFRVWSVLRAMTDPSGQVDVQARTLAGTLGMHEGSVSRAIKRLCAAGFSAAPTRRGSNGIRIRLSTPPPNTNIAPALDRLLQQGPIMPVTDSSHVRVLPSASPINPSPRSSAGAISSQPQSSAGAGSSPPRSGAGAISSPPQSSAGAGSSPPPIPPLRKELAAAAKGGSRATLAAAAAESKKLGWIPGEPEQAAADELSGILAGDMGLAAQAVAAIRDAAAVRSIVSDWRSRPVRGTGLLVLMLAAAATPDAIAERAAARERRRAKQQPRVVIPAPSDAPADPATPGAAALDAASAKYDAMTDDQRAAFIGTLKHVPVPMRSRMSLKPTAPTSRAVAVAELARQLEGMTQC